METKDFEKTLYSHEELYDADMIKEAASAYNVPKQQGEFTIEDYYEIPDNVRAELIDGVIYDMGAPVNAHQFIAGQIYSAFDVYIKKKKGKCIPGIAPIDVQLDRDNRTMVQPDVLIICDRNKIKKRVVYGAPDLVVEVLSPSTRIKDISIKMKKYHNAGVREYWIVDPDKKRVYVYEFEKEELPAVYTFEDKVPVGIFEGECEVDFAEIYEYVRFLYEDENDSTEVS